MPRRNDDDENEDYQHPLWGRMTQHKKGDRAAREFYRTCLILALVQSLMVPYNAYNTTRPPTTSNAVNYSPYEDSIKNDLLAPVDVEHDG
jgi:hypothetical protein